MLDLSIAPVAIDFRHDPIARRQPALQPVKSRLQVTMIDRSIGGRLHAMTKRRICGELRTALAGHAESHAAILGSMKTYGCRF